MRATTIWTALVLAVASGASAAAPAPAGWRPARADDVERVARRMHMPASDRYPGQKLRVSADFDGDGRADRAEVLVNSAGSRLAVVIYRGAGGASQKVAEDTIDKLADVGLEIEPPGVYPTACGRGGGPDGGPCRPQIKTTRPAVSLTYFEASTQIFFWNGKRFDSEFLSD